MDDEFSSPPSTPLSGRSPRTPNSARRQHAFTLSPRLNGPSTTPASSPSAGALIRRQVRQVVSLDMCQFVDPIATELGLSGELKAKLRKFAKVRHIFCTF